MTRPLTIDGETFVVVDIGMRMLTALRGLAGHVVLSGYASELYDDALPDWRRIEIAAMADRAQPRTEVIWCNFEDHGPLFASQTQGGV